LGEGERDLVREGLAGVLGIGQLKEGEGAEGEGEESAAENTGAAGMAPANLNFNISVETTAFWPVFKF
jgi:hypothetical protein